MTVLTQGRLGKRGILNGKFEIFLLSRINTTVSLLFEIYTFCRKDELPSLELLALASVQLPEKYGVLIFENKPMTNFIHNFWSNQCQM